MQQQYTSMRDYTQLEISVPGAGQNCCTRSQLNNPLSYLVQEIMLLWNEMDSFVSSQATSATQIIGNQQHNCQSTENNCNSAFMYAVLQMVVSPMKFQLDYSGSSW